MNRFRRSMLGVALLAAWTAACAGNDVIFERSSDDGAVELTNVPEDGGAYHFLMAPSATAVAPAGPAPRTSAGRAAPYAVPIAPAPTVAPTQAREAGSRERLQSLYEASRAAREAQMSAGKKASW